MTNTETTQVIRNNKNEAMFRIENNIVIGKELEIIEKCNNAGEIILEIFKKKPDFIGQIEATTGRQCTYKEMMEKSIRCAIWLRKQGVMPGDTVAACCSSYFDGYVPFLACLYIGAEFAIEYHKLPTRAFCHFLSIVTPKIIFLHNNVVDNFISAQNELNTNIQRVIFEDGVSSETSLNEILSQQTPSEIENFCCENIENPKQVALLIGTSGSTGLSKMAELSHLSLKTMLHPACTVAIPNRVILCTAGMRWITYFLCTLGGFAVNATRIIVDDVKSAKYYCEVIKKYKVECYLCDTNQIRQIYKFNLIDDYRATNLIFIGFGGSPFSREIHESLIKQLPQITVCQIYGSTDIGNYLTWQLKGCKPGSTGYICPGSKIKILSTKTGELLGPNQQGEIYAKATSQLNGYRNNREATKKAIDSKGWLRMNDIGYYNEDGEFYVVARISEFIKYKDCSLSVPEMETVLDNHPAVYKVAIVSIPDDIDGELPFAVVIKLPNAQVTERELMSYFTNNMPEFYKLGGIKFVNDLPRTSTGKIAKNDLKQMICSELI